MQLQYRVTKYDPRKRDSSGAYRSEGWTSWSDVGRSFAGIPLTEERYLRVEKAYLDVAAAFLDEAKIAKLRVVGLENHRESRSAPANGSLIQSEEIRDVLRALLREEYWCKLESPSAFVHVGYDYYMYLGVPHQCPVAEALARRCELFAEVFPSPYLENAV